MIRKALERQVDDALTRERQRRTLGRRSEPLASEDPSTKRATEAVIESAPPPPAPSPPAAATADEPSKTTATWVQRPPGGWPEESLEGGITPPTAPGSVRNEKGSWSDRVRVKEIKH